MRDKEKTAEVLRRINILTAGNVADNFIKINEFRLGSGYRWLIKVEIRKK